MALDQSRVQAGGNKLRRIATSGQSRLNDRASEIQASRQCRGNAPVIPSWLISLNARQRRERTSVWKD
jgi:hypothetical protein